MEGWLPIFFLLVVLKVPVIGALWLIWWASKEPGLETHSDDSEGGPGRWRPLRPRPRGPHGAPGGLSRGRGHSPAPRRPFPIPSSRPQTVGDGGGGPSGGACEPGGRVPEDGHPSRSHTA